MEKHVCMRIFLFRWYFHIEWHKLSFSLQGQGQGQNFNSRAILNNLTWRNKRVYNAIVRELIRRQLNIRTRGQNFVSRPVTVDLSNNVFNQQNTLSNTQTVRQPFQDTNTISQYTRQSFMGNRDFNGTPFQLISTNLQSSAPTNTNQLQQTQNAGGFGSVTSNVQQSVNNIQSGRKFGSMITLGRNGGFVFQAQNGVRLKLPSKSGSLSIRSRGNGIDFNYLTPPPTTTPQNEEEETEIWRSREEIKKLIDG